VRAIETKLQPAERSVVEALSYPDLEKMAARDKRELQVSPFA
jgi:hypothetical protein